jgi:AP-2 complex subunit alpha
VIIRYKAVVELDLQYQLLNYAVMFLEVDDPNVRYLTLDSMTAVLVLPRSGDALKDQFPRILAALGDVDTSVRRRALDLLYLMCNGNNVGEIIEELLNYSERTDASLKEELVLKIAILAEKFAPDLSWYVDVVIRLLTKSGDQITDDIWWRVCQVATGFKQQEPNQQLQAYASTAVATAL